jgi:ABC-type tungstate transport system substrate-binding protein
MRLVLAATKAAVNISWRRAGAPLGALGLLFTPGAMVPA